MTTGGSDSQYIITVKKFGQQHTHLEPNDYGMKNKHAHIRVIDVYET